MHGLGNDFVVLNALTRPLELSADQLRWIADRHCGIGCDQILLVEPARLPDTDFYYRIFNADGGEVEQCGNGARCFVRYVGERGLTAKTAIRIGTLGGIIEPWLEPDGQITVGMGVPEFEPSRIPFDAPARASAYVLDLGGGSVGISAVSMGNPHAVQVVADIEAAPVALQGPLIERHPRFPQRVNAGYMQVVSRSRILLRVHERGAGETLACGTGAAAVTVAGVLNGHTDRRLLNHLLGGDLEMEFAEDGHVYMTGPAVQVFEGDYRPQ
jgi:diaminopimelate epimerase